MSPLLERETQIRRLSKFVRDDQSVAHEPDLLVNHSDVAKNHNIGETKEHFVFGEQVFVDDGGYIEEKNGVIYISGITSSCELKGSRAKARLETIKVVGEITGKKVITED